MNDREKTIIRLQTRENFIKVFLLIASFLLFSGASGLAQTKPTCQAYFQVVQMDHRIPDGMKVGMNAEQKAWWEKKGQKQYPELCWNGSIDSAEKPRFLLIWSSEAPGGPVRVPKSTEQSTGADVYGQSISAIKETAVSNGHLLLRRTILIENISAPGEPPIELIKDWWFFHSYSQRVLAQALAFLTAAPPYPPSASSTSAETSHGASREKSEKEPGK